MERAKGKTTCLGAGVCESANAVPNEFCGKNRSDSYRRCVVSGNSYLQAIAGAVVSMLRRNLRRWAVTAAVLVVALVCAGGAIGFSGIFKLQPFLDPTGVIATYNTGGNIDTTNTFFQSLGTNGRSCATCHQASDAFGLSAAHAQARFASTEGADPLFAAFDGANCFPDVPVYRILGCPDPFASPSTTGLPNPPTSFYTTDPGKALITGMRSDFNRGKGPILRGLAARAVFP